MAGCCGDWGDDWGAGWGVAGRRSMSVAGKVARLAAAASVGR